MVQFDCVINSNHCYLESPKITITKVNNSALICEAHGVPRPAITWRQNLRTIDHFLPAINLHKQLVGEKTTRSLIVIQIASKPSNYTCSASNPEGFVLADQDYEL